MLYVDPEHHARGHRDTVVGRSPASDEGRRRGRPRGVVLGRKQPARDWYEHRGLSLFAESHVQLGDQVEVEIGYALQRRTGKCA